MAYKKRLFLMLAVCLTLVLSSSRVPVSSQDGFVWNGDFKQHDTAVWTPYHQASIVSEQAFGGRFCAKLSKNSGYEQTIQVQPDRIYRLTGYAKVEYPGDIMTIGVKNYSGAQVFCAATKSEYQKLSLVFRTGEGDTDVTIFGFRQDNGTGSGFFDEISVEQITEDTANEPLTNAKEPVVVPTYDGSNQPTHPSVVYFENGFQGYRYWMAMTPYPYNRGLYENPSIVVSNDGKQWILPEELHNPLVRFPSVGHYCDVDLVYDPAYNELKLYFVYSDDRKGSQVKLMRSRDGISWTAPQTVIDDQTCRYGVLSPSIEILPNGTYMMWYVNTGNIGYKNQSNQIELRLSKDGITWSAPQVCSDFVQPGYQIWHLDVFYDAKADRFHAIYPAYPNGTNCDHSQLFYAWNETGHKWQSFFKPILRPGQQGAWDDQCVYRSSVLIDSEQDEIKIWYGAKKKSDYSWHIGYTQNQLSSFLTAVQE